MASGAVPPQHRLAAVPMKQGVQDLRVRSFARGASFDGVNIVFGI